MAKNCGKGAKTFMFLSLLLRPWICFTEGRLLSRRPRAASRSFPNAVPDCSDPGALWSLWYVVILHDVRFFRTCACLNMPGQLCIGISSQDLLWNNLKSWYIMISRATSNEVTFNFTRTARTPALVWLKDWCTWFSNTFIWMQHVSSFFWHPPVLLSAIEVKTAKTPKNLFELFTGSFSQWLTLKVSLHMDKSVMMWRWAMSTACGTAGVSLWPRHRLVQLQKVRYKDGVPDVCCKWRNCHHEWPHMIHCMLQTRTECLCIYTV